jgi:hypothetical protein
VVALAGGGLLLTQPQSMTPTINKLDVTFIFVSSFTQLWFLGKTIVGAGRQCQIGANYPCAAGLLRLRMSPPVLHCNHCEQRLSRLLDLWIVLRSFPAIEHPIIADNANHAVANFFHAVK